MFKNKSKQENTSKVRAPGNFSTSLRPLCTKLSNQCLHLHRKPPSLGQCHDPNWNSRCICTKNTTTDKGCIPHTTYPWEQGPPWKRNPWNDSDERNDDFWCFHRCRTGAVFPKNATLDSCFAIGNCWKDFPKKPGDQRGQHDGDYTERYMDILWHTCIYKVIKVAVGLSSCAGGEAWAVKLCKTVKRLAVSVPSTLLNQ